MAVKKNHYTKLKNILKKIFFGLGNPFFKTFYFSILFVFKLLNTINSKTKNYAKFINRIKIYKFSKPNLLRLRLNLRNKTFAVAIVGLLIFSPILLFLNSLPSLNQLEDFKPDRSTKIYDRNGELLYEIFKDENRSLVDIKDLPSSVIYSTLAIEDAEFYEHIGLSVRGTIRAFSKNIKEGTTQGGSTITQQLIKNTLLTPEKTYERKIKEIILALFVETKFSKDQILEMYLNQVSYGGTAYGIASAAKYYFDKDVQDLTLAQSAMLAGLIQSPTKYSPFGSNPELAFSRQREVLRLMRINGFISANEETQAAGERITFRPKKYQIQAPHFVMYLREKLEQEDQYSNLETSGYNITTTIDIKLHREIEKIINSELDKIKNLNAGNAAVLVLDLDDNSILTMIGGRDYFDNQNSGSVNVTTRPRQPGSTVKPILYSLALEEGMTLSSIIDDSPVTYKLSEDQVYKPKNYDNKYVGKIPLRSALAQSRNIPAVKILRNVGVSKMLKQGQRFGIESWNNSQAGLSLALGSSEATLLEMAKAYTIFAKYGKLEDLKYLVSTEKDGHKSTFSQDHLPEIIDPRISFLITDVLSDSQARRPAFGTNSYLEIKNHPEVAVKTGTSNNLRDNLAIGYNQKYLVAVWVGNNDGSPMKNIASGITGAAPIWNRVMTYLLSNSKPQTWNAPQGLTQVRCFNKPEWYLVEKQTTCPQIVEPAASTALLQ